MTQVLGRGRAEGVFEAAPLEATAQMVLAALNEGGSRCGAVGGPRAASEAIAAASAGFTERLRAG